MTNSKQFLLYTLISEALSAAAPSKSNINPATNNIQRDIIIKDCIFDINFSSVSARKPITYSMINDGFCDCANGVDEPQTSACAGFSETFASYNDTHPPSKQHSSLFYCSNQGSKPKYIYSTHVRDGICDCCDGSDEKLGHTVCQNTCVQDGATYRKEMERLREEIKKAKEMSNKYAFESKENGTKGRQDLLSLEAKLKALEKEEQQIKVHLDAAHHAVYTEREEAEKNNTETSDAASEKDSTTTESTTTSSETDTTTAATVSEYAKWMDKDADVDYHDDSYHETPSRELTSAEKEVDRFQNLLSEKQAEIRKCENDITFIKESVDAMNKYGAWSTLTGQTLEYTSLGYTYKIEFFKSAHQDYISLGTFDSFNSDAKIPVLSFKDGDWCPGGPARSLELRVHCGFEEKLFDVSEPERCAYIMDMTHPLGCHDNLVDDGKAEYPEHYSRREEL